MIYAPYRKPDEFLSVDMDKLRPKGSYAKLLAARTHSIDELVRQYGEIPPDLLKTRSCPSCNSTEKTKEIEKDHLSIVRCSRCDLVYVDPIFDDTHYRNTYTSKDYQRIVKDHGEESHDYRKERFGTERVGIMQRFLAHLERPRFLDIGCSTGFVVEAANDVGWDAQGIDLNPSAISYGQARDLRISKCALEDFEAEDESFDAIGLFDVLEHVVDPKAVMTSVMRLLSPGGIVFIYVPNYDSASRLLMGSEAHFIWPTHHLTYFTPETLQDFVKSIGGQVELMMTEGLDIADYLWNQREKRGRDMSTLSEIADLVQFFINGALYGKNLRLIAKKPA